MPKYRYGEIEADDQVGLVTGLAWTEVGGELLTIEGVMLPGGRSLPERNVTALGARSHGHIL